MALPSASSAPVSARTPSADVRPPTALPALAVLMIVFSSWVLAPLRLARGWPPDLGFTRDNTLYVLITTTAAATVLLVLGAVSVRARWLVVAAGVVALLHGAAAAAMLLIQLMGEARAEFLLESGLLLAALTCGLIATVFGVFACRAHSHTPLLIALALGGAAVALEAAADQARYLAMTHGQGWTVWSLIGLTSVAALGFAAALAGLRAPGPRVIAAAVLIIPLVDRTRVLVSTLRTGSGRLGVPGAGTLEAMGILTMSLRVLAVVAAIALLIAAAVQITRRRQETSAPPG